MKSREAKPADYQAIADFANAAWQSWALSGWVVTPKRLVDAACRNLILEEAGAIVGVTCCREVEAVSGPGFEVVLFIVDRSREDKMDLALRLSLAALDIAIAEGRFAISSKRDLRVPGLAFGVDVLEMDSRQEGIDPNTGKMSSYIQTSDARAMRQVIAKLRPTWRL